MKKVKKTDKPRISKENFLGFLADATPEELNQFILEYGKPPKLIQPLYFFKRDSQG